MLNFCRVALCSLLFLVTLVCTTFATTREPADPEAVIRALVRANSEKDMSTLSRLMAHDADITSYSVGGRKYVGWPEFEQEMR
jgi:hypothetical protein